MKPVSMALIGLGGMGLRHADAMARMERDGVELVRLDAIHDANGPRAEAFAASYAERTGRELTVYDSLEDLLASSVEAVDIVVPTRLHHPLVLQALDAGKHVLVEKPMALTIRAGRSIADRAETTGLVVAVGHNFRRTVANRALRSLIRGGIIGDPYMTSTVMLEPSSDPLSPKSDGTWHWNRSFAGSHVGLEQGIHEMDLLRQWFGDIDYVQATVTTFGHTAIGPNGDAVAVTADDALCGILRFESGVLGQVTLSMAAHGGAYARRVIMGSKGRLTSRGWHGWTDGEVVLDSGERLPSRDLIDSYMGSLPDREREQLFPAGTYDATDFTVSPSDPMRYGIAMEIVDFARAIRTGGSPEVAPREALRNVATAIALLESSSAGCRIKVSDVEEGAVTEWQRPIDEDLAR